MNLSFLLRALKLRGDRRISFIISTGLPVLLFSWGCAPPEPSEELMIRHRWVEGANRHVLSYACPEAQRLPLESEDPLRAAAAFVQRGKQLEHWATDPIELETPRPVELAESLDSLRAAIGVIAISFRPAIATAASHERECYGTFALNCTKAVRARDILSRIDAGTLRKALNDYFRHRAALAEKFAKAGAPLGGLTACREGDKPAA